jgi:hypothetical protein
VIALLVNPDNEMAEQHIRTTQEGARAKGIKLAVLKARTEAAIDAAFEQLQARALLVSADAFFNRCARNSWRFRRDMPFRRCITARDGSQRAV